MDWTMWVTAAAAYVGAGLSFVATKAGVRQRERSDLRVDAREQRAEWGRRLDTALSALASSVDWERRLVGRTILESLVADEGAPSADRELADRLLGTTRGAPFTEERDSDLDGSGRAGDNEEDAGGAR